MFYPIIDSMKKKIDRTELTPRAIVVNNVFTYFNAIFVVIAILLIIAGSYRSLTFLPVVVANALIGIVQQLRARKVLHELSLLARSTYVIIRDNQQLELPSEELLVGDHIVLTAGQQIPADAVVIEGSIAANESLLTGEADEIEKTPEATLLSGSFVVSGRCTAQLTQVGEDCYAAKLQAKAKQLREKPSEMVHDIDLIVRVAGIVIIPLGALLFYQSMFVNGQSFSASVEAMVGAAIGMVPEGLYLLVTVALALSALRLAQNHVLLHDMRSTETLARVDVLCVDKTGTITDNNMEVVEAFLPDGTAASQTDASVVLLQRYVASMDDSNATMQALHAFTQPQVMARQAGASGQDEMPVVNASQVAAEIIKPLDAVKRLAFSSKNKFSELQTADTRYRLGAPEFVLDEQTFLSVKACIDERVNKGQRVLVLAAASGDGADGASSDGGHHSFQPLLFVSLVNGLRPNVADTFAWFGQQDVRVMVISGDNPQTVSRIASQVGIPAADKFVSADHLADVDLLEAVKEFTIFGRVKPEQKKDIVEALKAHGLRVAMTGDGVNDILAMKEADCSIAMGTGGDAARQAAQVVILDDDFSHMKQIISEGRRDINNLLRSATLFLYKNIFSILLATFSILFAWVYPLKPSQVSLVSMFNIGVPAFLLAMEQNSKKQQGRFLYEALFQSIPPALTAFFSIAIMVSVARWLGIGSQEAGVVSALLLSFAGFMVLFDLSKPFTPWHSFIFIGCVLGYILTAVFLSDLFAMSALSFEASVLATGFCVFEAVVMVGAKKLIALLRDRTPQAQ